MDVVASSGLSAFHTTCINAVRIYNKLLSISDMVTADGTRILEWVLWPIEGNIQPTSNLHWPHQKLPHQHVWQVRRDAIRNIFTIPGTDWLLKEPLGPWKPSHEHHQCFIYMIHLPTNHLWNTKQRLQHYNLTGNVYSSTGFPGSITNRSNDSSNMHKHIHW